jgi:hypothetical protein
MADKFYGVALGKQTAADVTESGSTTSAAIELRISDTAYAQPLLAQLAIEAIKNYIQSKETHPIA